MSQTPSLPVDGTAGQFLVKASGASYDVAWASPAATAELLAIGCNTFDRNMCTATFALAGSGAVILTGFTAPTSMVARHLVAVVTTPGTSLTDAWLLLFSVDAGNNCTLIAQSASNPALFQVGGRMTVSIPATPVVSGARYAVGALINYTGTSPTFLCAPPSPGASLIMNTIPFGAVYATLATPASIPAGSLNPDSPAYYFEIGT